MRENPGITPGAGGSELAQLDCGEITIALRRAGVADVAPIVSLLTADQLGATREDATAAQLEPYLRAFAAIDADPAHLLVVGTHDTAVISTMQLSFLPGMARRGAPRAQIEAVRVDSAYRGRSIGRRMMTWAIAEARRRGCALVQLTSDKRRRDAHRFYEQLGFVASHEGLKLRL